MSEWGRKIQPCGVWIACAVLATCFVTPGVMGADSPTQGKLILRDQTIELSQIPSLLHAGATFESGPPYVIHLDGPMTPGRRAALSSAGVTLRQYLPIDAYIAELGRADAKALLDAGFVDWIGAYQDSWKVSQQIGTYQFVTKERRDLEAQGKRRLVAHSLTRSGADRIAQKAATMGGKTAMIPTHRGDRRVGIELKKQDLQKFLTDKDVLYIDEAPEAEPRNSTTSWIVQSDVTNVRTLWNMGLHGENQIAGIVDWDLRADHCSFNDPSNPIGPLHRKLLAYYGMGINPAFGYHGTHVGCTFAGKEVAETNPDLKGLAYESKIVFQHYNGVTVMGIFDAYGRFTIAHNDGARVHNNSWGNSETFYNQWAHDIDAFTWDNEDDLVLVAIINTSTVRTPENAKNCLAVAASKDTPNESQKCKGGIGPTTDGRLKPEVFAPGCGSRSADVNTTCGNDDTGIDGGTSYATPAVSAMGILTRQYFMEGFYPTGVPDVSHGFTPSGALLKAMLINSAVDMSGIAGYFNTTEGWGRIKMDDVIYFAGDSRKTLIEDVRNASGLSTGETRSYYVVVGPGTMQLKVTLVWSDAAAAVMAGLTPVNNLDLFVESPVATMYRGNVFSGANSTTGGSSDTLNNTEQVHIATPLQGTWRIDVSGTAVNQGTQGYALVVTGDVDCVKGDVNGDGVLDGLDIGAFVRVLMEGGQFFPKCAADVNFSGAPDIMDCDGFVNTILGP